MMKITKLSLSISVLSLLAVLPQVQASELIMNCTQVTADGKSCAKALIPFDYSDSPDPTFPSLLASDGARHQLGSSLMLGSCVDADPGVVGSGTLGGMADKDDLYVTSPVFGTCAADGNDEDGVTVGDLMIGKQAVTVDIVSTGACKLNAWVDWNRDGDWFDLAEQIFTDQQLVAGNNTLTLDVPAFATAGDAYARFRCSSAGGDGITGEAADGEVEDYKLSIIEQPAVPVSIGNFIWLDGNEDGQQSAGENGLVNAVVSLLAADGQPARDLDGQVVASVTVAADGAYLFSNLPEGEYIVRVVPPVGYIPTSGGADADTDASNSDNNCIVTDAGVQTLPVTLTAGAEPELAADGDDSNGNLTVDCGFYRPADPLHSIGNQVWVDDGAGNSANANNGVRDNGEGPVPNGVTVELHDGIGQLIQQTTTANGFYLFHGLPAGDYKVCIAASNFATGAVLAGYTASTGGDEADINLNIDSHDNGSNDTTQGLCSAVLALGVDEPLAELPAASGVAGNDGMGTEDERSNLTVDFGVLPPPPAKETVAIGNYLWLDSDVDGYQDSTEPALAGAVVRLLTGTGQAATDINDQPVAPQTTDASGLYRFDNLAEGDYVVSIQPPAGYYLTLGGLDVDDDATNVDSNCIADTDGLVKTHPVTLTIGGEPDVSIDGDGKNANMTADCGFYQAVSVGDTIWEDLNANGYQDDGEPGLAGITVSITEADAVTPVYDVFGEQVASVSTGASGYYHFENLVPGNYIINVQPPEKGYQLSPDGANVDSNPSNTDSNCVSVEGGFQTRTFSLFDQASVGAVDNPTVDCGFYRPVGVGSRLWIDLDGDGKQDGGEPGIAGATIVLLDLDGKPAVDIHGNPVPSQTSGPNGEYFFGNLGSGDYVIGVALPNGYLPTVGGQDPDNNDQTDSNGTVLGSGMVYSQPVTLVWGEEPGTDGDGDKSTNLTVGFGFLPNASLQIPTVSQWGLGMLSLLMSSLVFWRRRRDS